MSSTTSTDRISELLTKADEFIEAQDLAKAAQALKEAARLDGDNVKVKEKWATFKKLEDGIGDVLDLLRIYIGSQAAEDGEKVLQVIRSKALAEDQAIEAIDLVLNARSKPRLLDSIATTLLARNTSARKGTATKLAENATKTFERFFQLGDESFNAFAAVPLEALLWLSKEQQTTAQKDVFRLCVATLIEPGAENLERVMTGITRLVAMAPDTIAPEIDAEDVDAILSSLDVRLPASLRSQATLAISKVLEATKERGEEMFSTFINQRAKKQTNDDLVIVFSGAAAVFPLIPVCAAKLFLTDGFVQQLVPNLERNFEEGQAGNR